jgi:hypothetical protein
MRSGRRTPAARAASVSSCRKIVAPAVHVARRAAMAAAALSGSHRSAMTEQAPVSNGIVMALRTPVTCCSGAAM